MEKNDCGLSTEQMEYWSSELNAVLKAEVFMGKSKEKVIEIRSHFWPITLNCDEIWALATQFRYLDHQLMDIGNKLYDEVIEGEMTWRIQ
jgi:hypothetical protein